MVISGIVDYLFTQITGKTISFPWSSGACGALVLLIFTSSVCPHKLQNNHPGKALKQLEISRKPTLNKH